MRACARIRCHPVPAEECLDERERRLERRLAHESRPPSTARLRRARCSGGRRLLLPEQPDQAGAGQRERRRARRCRHPRRRRSSGGAVTWRPVFMSSRVNDGSRDPSPESMSRAGDGVAARPPRASRAGCAIRRPAGAGITAARRSCRPSSARRTSRKRWWYRYHSRRAVERQQEEVARPPGRSITDAESSRSSTASQSGADSRSRIDVRSRKESLPARLPREQLAGEVVDDVAVVARDQVGDACPRRRLPR